MLKVAEKNHPKESEFALRMLKTLFQNIKDHPTEDKFRVIKLENKTIARLFGIIPRDKVFAWLEGKQKVHQFRECFYLRITDNPKGKIDKYLDNINKIYEIVKADLESRGSKEWLTKKQKIENEMHKIKVDIWNDRQEYKEKKHLLPVDLKPKKTILGNTLRVINIKGIIQAKPISYGESAYGFERTNFVKWHMNPKNVYVGSVIPGIVGSSEWAYPYAILNVGQGESLKEKYWEYLLNKEELKKKLPELRNKVIGYYHEYDKKYARFLEFLVLSVT